MTYCEGIGSTQRLQSSTFMATVAQREFVAETVAPADQSGVAEAVRAMHDASRAVYPLGGCTALDYGTPRAAATSVRRGVGLDLTGLSRIVDYTPRDMTILVEAGVRMSDLSTTLAAEGQQLPIDVPRASEATIGGVVASNWNGPRRHGYGTIRDYVIGIHAVDGRGVAFKGGGRVVKNVAGYDFCKLLTGSLGTLAVITQLALKLKPQAEQAAAIVAEFEELAAIETTLNRLAQLEAPPVAIDVLVGSGWRDSLRDCGVRLTDGKTPKNTGSPGTVGQSVAAIAVRVEGTEPEVAWLLTRIETELRAGGAVRTQQLTAQEADRLYERQVEFADRGVGDAPDDSPLVLKIAVPPSAVTATIAELRECDADCTIQAQAGSGIVFARLARIEAANVSRVLVGRLRPAAIQRGGNMVVVSTTLAGLTPHIVWGGRTETTVLLEQIKRAFDPQGILNPGQFVF